MMKKYSSLILLVIFLTVSNGYYLYFVYLQNNIHREIKNEIKNNLSEKDLSVIVISPENERKIRWLRKDKEFLFEGSFYDIVRSELKDGKRYYYCINDIREKQLIAQYVKQRRKKDKIVLKLKRIMGNKYFPGRFRFNVKFTQINKNYAEINSIYKSMIIDVSSPPPKVSFTHTIS
jgi:hypothetical protein